VGGPPTHRLTFTHATWAGGARTASTCADSHGLSLRRYGRPSELRPSSVGSLFLVTRSIPVPLRVRHRYRVAGRLAAAMLSWPSRPSTPFASLPRSSSSPSLLSAEDSRLPRALPDFESPTSPFSPAFRNTFAARWQAHPRGPFNTPERVAAARAARLELPAAGMRSGFEARQQALRRSVGGFHSSGDSGLPASPFSSPLGRESPSRPLTPHLSSASRIATPSGLRATPRLVTQGSLHGHGVQRPSWWGDGL
jgi:hypothetical protein